MHGLAFSLCRENFITKNPVLVLSGSYVGKDLKDISNFEWLRVLKIDNTEITDLSTIAGLTNLTELDFSSNKITDLSPIVRLTNLTRLKFSGNEISNLNPISKLTNLTELHFHGNKVTNLTSIAALTKLTKLGFDTNQIIDISPILKLTNLTELHFGRNKVTNITSIAKLTKLTKLSFVSNQINDLSPISKLTNLTELYFGGNEITDLSPIKKLTNLNRLGLVSNQISDLSPIAALTNLYNLDASNNKISDLKPISALIKLITLDFGDNEVTDLSPIANLTNLFDLNFRNNELTDLSPIEALTNLMILIIPNNKIIDLSPIAALTNLGLLDISNNKITDLSPIARLAKLTDLYFDFNQITELSPIQRLNNLELLDISNNKITDLSPIEHLFRKGCEINFEGNPITNPPLEIAKKGTNAILAYFDQAKTEGEIPLTKLKFFLLGNSTVGKSSLAAALMEKDLNKELIPTTHGIRTPLWQVGNITEGGITYPIEATFWDFGGQDYYHATHRIFLTPDALYLLIITEATEKDEVVPTEVKVLAIDKNGEQSLQKEYLPLQHHRHPYWLHNLQYYLSKYSSKQKVLLVENKCKENRNANIKISVNKDAFSVLELPDSFIPIDPEFALSNSNSQAAQRFITFKGDIKEEILEKLKNRKITKSYPLIEQAITKFAAKMTDDNMAELNQLCLDNDIEPPSKWPVFTPWITYAVFETLIRNVFYKNNPEFNIPNLVAYLQDSCGRVLHFDNIGLEDKICIDPIWLHEYIYKVLSPEVKAKDGLFTFSDVDEVVPEDEIPAKDMVNILKAYRLIFEVPWKESDVTDAERWFIAPQYLPEQLNGEKKIRFDAKMESLDFTPAFSILFPDFMPSAVISQFIASMGLFAENAIFWKYGILYLQHITDLKVNHLVQANMEEKRLELFLPKDLDELRQDTAISRFLEAVIIQNKEQENVLQIQLPGKEAIRYKEVKEKIEDSGKHYNTLCKDYERYVTSDKQIRVFFSYSHKQSEAFKLLVKELEEKWFYTLGVEFNFTSDLDIALNDRWHHFITNEVKRCDLFIGCLSQDYLLSPYIQEHEMGEILKRHQNENLLACFINMSQFDLEANKFFAEKQRFQPVYREIDKGYNRPAEIVYFEEIFNNEAYRNSYIGQLHDKLKPWLEEIKKRKLGNMN